jgi:predicted Zn-dependent protease
MTESGPEPATETQTRGFQMSGKRAALEILLVVVLGGGVVALVLGSARFFAARYADRVPLEVDRTIGEQSARALALAGNRCTDPAPARYVEGVVAPLLSALDDRRFSFQFVVVDDPEVNAFALPGGFVTVNMGLLRAAESGDEVAAVLSHELQHVVRRHGTERMLRELGASTLLSVIFGGTDIAVPAKAVHDFVSDAYDRAQESEADERGLALLGKAGIDPRGMSRFFERLAKTSVNPPALLSTHPDPGDRARKAAEAAKGARVTVVLPPPPKEMKCKEP